MIRTLAKSMADVNLRCHGLEEMFRQPDIHTPLMLACKSKQDPEVLSTLTELQADVNTCCACGLSVPNWIPSPGQVKKLATAKADLESMNPFRQGPLASAASWANAETVAQMSACRCDLKPSAISIPCAPLQTSQSAKHWKRPHSPRWSPTCQTTLHLSLSLSLQQPIVIRKPRRYCSTCRGRIFR